MMDWSTFEAMRASLFDSLRTLVFLVGAVLAYVELRESYKLRRLQAISSLNDRLSRCTNAHRWINNPARTWDDLDDETRYEYQNYVTAFEDVGAARRLGIISLEDFLKSYGGRYRKLFESGTLKMFMSGAGYDPGNFDNLQVLNKDIGKTF